MKSKRINILYFSSFGSMKGGGQRSLYYLVRGLDKDIFTPIVVCPEEGDLVSSLKELGIETIIIPFKRLRDVSLKFILHLLSVLRERNIALIHTDAPAETFYAGLAAKIAGLPLIWHIRVSDDHKKINKLLDRLLPYLCTRLILVAGTLEQRFYRLKGSKKLTVVYNAVDLEEFDHFPKSRIREEIKINENAVLIACIGRIEEMKGQKHLARAISRLVEARQDVKTFRNFKILLIGEAECNYFNELQVLIRELQIGNFFIYLGYRHDIPGILKDIDILVLPSVFGEGLSRIILEAMAAGKPIITTDIGGNQEAVLNGINGYVIKPCDDKALALAIEEFLEDPKKRRNLGKIGRERVEKNFTIDKNIREICKVYDDLLN